MHPATRSIKFFGIYVVLTGIGLLFAPALALAPLGLAAPTEVWVRVLGALAIVVGYYYWACGSAGALAFFRASIRGRMLFAALMLLLVVLFNAPAQLLLFGVIDLLGAAWTAQGMRAGPPEDASAAAV
jgi:hypothetical protein